VRAVARAVSPLHHSCPYRSAFMRTVAAVGFRSRVGPGARVATVGATALVGAVPRLVSPLLHRLFRFMFLGHRVVAGARAVDRPRAMRGAFAMARIRATVRSRATVGPRSVARPRAAVGPRTRIALVLVRVVAIVAPVGSASLLYIPPRVGRLAVDPAVGTALFNCRDGTGTNGLIRSGGGIGCDGGKE